MKNTRLCMINPPTNGTARILALQVSTAEGPVHLVCVYAPTLQSPADVKDQFYKSLDCQHAPIDRTHHSPG